MKRIKEKAQKLKKIDYKSLSVANANEFSKIVEKSLPIEDFNQMKNQFLANDDQDLESLKQLKKE